MKMAYVLLNEIQMMMRTSLIVLFTLSLFCLSCDQGEELNNYDCWHLVYFETSAVCSSFNEDAGIRDSNGNVFIAQDFFMHISKAEATVGRPYYADIKEIPHPDERIPCNLLLDAPYVEILCIRTAD